MFLLINGLLTTRDVIHFSRQNNQLRVPVLQSADKLKKKIKKLNFALRSSENAKGH